MAQSLELHDVVALLVDLPDHRLSRGQVGTVTELLLPNAYEVEFSDDEGRTYATLGLKGEQLMLLRYHAAAG